MSAKQFGITQISCAIVGWGALQGVTQEWQEERWFKYLREIDVKEPPRTHRSSHRRCATSFFLFSSFFFQQNIEKDHESV